MASIERSFVLIHPEDNVLICCRQAEADDQVEIDGVVLRLRTPIGVGHKIARRPLGRGDKVIKYGMAIGSVTAPLEAADHVHGHNMQSDYLPSHSRETTTLDEGRS
jgi:hypothetical protein